MKGTDKIYLVSTVKAEYGCTHNHIANLYSREDLTGTDYERHNQIPTKVGVTKTIIEDVEGDRWLTTITKVA